MANKSVVTITINADGKEVRETTKEVERLNDGLHELDVRQAREAQEVLKNLGNTDLNQITRNLKEVKMATAGIDDEQLKNAQTAVKELGSEAQQTAKVYTDASGRLRDANGKFVKSASDVKNASDNMGAAVSSAAKQFDKLKNAGETVQNFGNKIQGIGQTLTVGLTVPIVGLGAAVATVGIGYEQALNSFQAVTKATTEEMAQAAKVAKELGADDTLPATSARDAALAMEELGKSGMNAAQSMAAAKGVLQLAAAGQLEEAKAAEITANALNSFNLKAEESVRVADLLAAASNASSAGVGDIAEALSQSSASFAAAKVPIEDLTAAIAIMANAGIKGSDAGTSLKTFLSSIQAPSKAGADALEELGIKVFDAQGKMKAFPELIGLFEKSLNGLTDEKKVGLIQNIFGSDASRAAQILFKEGAAGFDKIKGAVTQTGAAADLAAAKTKGVGGAWESLKSQAETIGITIYDAVKGRAETALKSFGETLGRVSDYLSQLAQNNPELIQMGVVFLGIVAAVGPLMVALGALIVGIGSVVGAIGTIGAAWATASAAIAAAGGVFAALGTVITGTILPALAAAAPIILTVVAVVGVLAAAAGALYLAWTTNFGNIQGNVSVFVSMVTEAFNSLMTIIQPAIDAVSTYAVEGFDSIRQWWATNGKAISQAAEQVFAVILRVVQSYIDSAKQFWADHGAQITSIAQSIWNIVKTIVSTGIAQIGNVIMLITNVINGNWSGAWANFKAIVQAGVIASGSILKSLVNIVFQILQSVVIAIYNAGADFLKAAYDIGASIVSGIINGITSGVGKIASAAWDLGKRAINSIKESVDSHSPSREAHKVGEFVGDGFANGIENRTAKVKAAAKKIGDETIKALRDALKEFEKLAGISPEKVQRIQEANRIKDATSGQQEIIKLRGELGVNNYKPLPSDVASTESELKYLRWKKQAADDYLKSLDAINDGHKESLNLAEEEKKAFADKLVGIQQSGAAELLNLSKEIDLLGVTDSMERRRIENYYSVMKLRQDMANDGYGEKQIDEASEILRLENARTLELQRILDIRKQVVEAGSLEKSLIGDLTKLQNGGRELSEYEKTLQKINTDLKDINPQQKEYLLTIAAQIDAQKEFNEVYKQTYDFIRNTLDILTDSKMSFGEKAKSIFGGIANKLKENFLDNLAGSLTNIVLGVDISKSDNPVISEIETSNSHLKTIIGLLSGTTLAGGSSIGAGGGGFGGIVSKLLGGIFGGGGNRGASTGGFAGGNPLMQILGIGGGGNSSTITLPNGELAMQVNAGSGRGGNLLSQIFGKNGSIWGDQGFGNNVGTYGAIGGGANFIGSLIGGRWGGAISGAGSGMAMGAQIGSVVPGIGTAIGAGVGAVAGFLTGLFTNTQRKKDEELRTQYYMTASDEFNKLINALDQRPPGIDPAAARAQGDQIIAQYNQAASSLKDKKTRDIALREVTGTNGVIYNRNKYLNEAMQRAADWQKNEANRKKNNEGFTGEFAGGVYMDSSFQTQYDEFKRHNGLLPGVFTGRDYIRALIGDGEMVLNAAQQMRVIANARAGHDNPFEDAGIPGYQNAPEPTVPRYASGVSFNAPTFPSSSNSQKEPQIIFGKDSFSVAVYIDGERVPDERIKSLSIESNKKHMTRGGRK